MGRFLLKRLGYMVLTLWVVITLTFFMMNLLPGDSISNRTKQLPPEIEANMRARLGLNHPVYVRYFYYLRNLIQGDLGESLNIPGYTVKQLIGEKFPASMRYGLQAILIGVTIGIILGIVAAFNRNTWIDFTVIFIAIVGVSVPSFVLAVFLQKTLGNQIAIAGWEGSSAFFPQFKYTILPTIAGSLGMIASYSRFMKTQILDVINQDYILTAKAKGVGRVSTIVRHILRNAMIPVVTLLPTAIVGTMAGSFVLERIFAIPGLGQYFVNCIQNRDYTVIMGTTVFYAALYVVALLAVDLLYGVVDPRIRITGGSR